MSLHPIFDGVLKNFSKAQREVNTPPAHTKGPWFVSPQGYYVRYHIPGFANCNICDVDCGAPLEEREANARLIAAAPELLAALVELVERAEAEGNLDGLPEYEQARAAIAKAEGRA